MINYSATLAINCISFYRHSNDKIEDNMLKSIIAFSRNSNILSHDSLSYVVLVPMILLSIFIIVAYAANIVSFLINNNNIVIYHF